MRILASLLFLTSSIFGGDYSPHVRIHNVGREMVWSGVLIDSPNGEILTVGHPFFGLDCCDIKVQVEFVPTKPDLPVRRFWARLDRYDYDRDLGLLDIAYKGDLAEPLSFGESPPIGELCEARGYVMFEALRAEKCTVLSLNSHFGCNGEKLSLFKGKAVVGLSGSAIIHDGKIVAIQHSGDSATMSTILGASPEQIKIFLEENTCDRLP